MKIIAHNCEMLYFTGGDGPGKKKVRNRRETRGQVTTTSTRVSVKVPVGMAGIATRVIIHWFETSPARGKLDGSVVSWTVNLVIRDEERENDTESVTSNDEDRGGRFVGKESA